MVITKFVGQDDIVKHMYKKLKIKMVEQYLEKRENYSIRKVGK